MLATVRAVAPTAPTAAASVGDATPAKMEPSTATIRKRGGNMARVMRHRKALPPMPANSSFGMAGARSGQMMAAMRM